MKEIGRAANASSFTINLAETESVRFVIRYLLETFSGDFETPAAKHWIETIRVECFFIQEISF